MTSWHARLKDFELLKQTERTKMELSIAKTSIKNNTLSYPDFYKVTRWIDENQDKLKGLTQEQISKQASAETGLTVTISNVRAIAATLDIQLGKPGGYKGVSSVSKDINRTLARAIVELYNKLGEEVPDALKAIATR